MVLGPSGSGKTTLLKAIKGLLRPARGRVLVFSREGGTIASPASRDVAYIPQHLGLVQSLTALENTLTGSLGRVATLPSLVKAFPRPLVEEAQATLAGLGLLDKAAEKVHALSGGERQRVAIARALLQGARLVVADELVSQLDPVRAREVMEAVHRLARGGTTFVISCHEVDLVGRYGDQAVFLRQGEVAYEGRAAAVDRALAERFLR